MTAPDLRDPGISLDELLREAADAGFREGARAQRAEVARRYRAQAESLKERGDPTSRKSAAFLVVMAAEIASMPLAEPKGAVEP